MVRRLMPRAGRRRAALAVLAALVLALHLGVTRQVADGLIDFSAAQATPARIEVAYVRELELTAPPAVAPRMPVAAAAMAAPAVVAPAASAAEPATPPAAKPKQRPEPPEPRMTEPSVTAAAEPDQAPVPAPDVVPEPSPARPSSAPEPASAAASEPAANTITAAAEPAASAASVPASFDWPASTRVSYILSGNYRGEVQGDAQVEWVRVGSRYQVHLDLTVGPSFAPLITRRMTSDGELGPAGLVPRRYDQDTQVVFRDRKRVAMRFDEASVTLANGDRRDTVPGVQDTASQFVQLTYLFTTNPQLLKVGGSFEMPLALPNRVDRWTYDVLDEETLFTPFGPLPTFHLKPRRESTKPGDLRAEIWFAPQLRYLPVRIRIEQDAVNFVDLMIARKPEMASP